MANEDKRAKLLAWLQTAIELELSTIPPYMVALLSMKPEANREAADLIRGVMIEEMLHLALVANVMNAVGGTVRLGPDNLPSYPLRLNFEGKRDFLVNLAPFSADNIQTFMKIEEPQALAAPAVKMVKEIDVPGLTIGEFYTNIVALLGELGPSVFTGDPARQLHDDYYWGGGNRIIPVSDLDSATQALDVVIVQGEGAMSPGDPLGHYYRFAEIFYQRRYAPGDDLTKPPTGAPLPVDYTAVYPIKVNPKSSDYPPGSAVAKLNDTFNARYTMMIEELEQALTGQPKVLYTAIMNGMHGLTSVAASMMSTPIDDDHTGCPTFNA
jgi:Ferritin-like